MTASTTAPSGCPSCGDAEQLYRFPALEPGFSVFECANCGMGRTWPPVPDAEIGSFYPVEYYGKNNVRFNPLFEYLTRVFRKRRARVIRARTEPGVALDVGCGRGMMLNNLRRYGYETFGIEMSDHAARHARDILGLEIFTIPLLDAPLAKGTFRVVIFWHSLEHIADPHAALRRAHELLEPGGLLVVAVPNYDSWQAKLFGRQWFHLDVPRHYWHFGSRSLATMLATAGFKVVQTDYFSFEQNPYGWIQSTLNLLGFKTNLLYSILKHEAARSVQLSNHPIQVAANVLLLPILLPLSIALTVFDAAIRSGGTMEMYAVKEAGAE